jgi:formylglycine-generating enzyme required for sulfatase activity
MIHTRTTWLLFTAGAVVALAVLVLLLLQSQKPKGTLIPPPGSHKAGDIWVANLAGKTTMEMVWCPPGKFLMGSPATEMGRGSNEFQHEATFTKGFWIGKYEITQRQWLALMGDNPSRSPQKEVVYWKIWKWEVPVWCKDFLAIRCQFPVDYVSWDDGQNFCQKAGDGFHLPTEAQWEYACRAGNTGSFAGTGVWKEMGWFHSCPIERQNTPNPGIG